MPILPTKNVWAIRQSQPSSQIIFLADRFDNKDYLDLILLINPSRIKLHDCIMHSADNSKKNTYFFTSSKTQEKTKNKLAFIFVKHLS